jgi:hypothetical protein
LAARLRAPCHAQDRRRLRSHRSNSYPQGHRSAATALAGTGPRATLTLHLAAILEAAAVDTTALRDTAAL